MQPTLRRRYHYKQNRFQQLRGFYHVVVTNSFTAAAESMALEQPTVTLQIQALEQEMKTKLFEKKRGGLVLTQAGKILFELAAPAIEILESLDQAFEERASLCEAGRVVCAAPDPMVRYLLPNLMHDFACKFPNIEVVLRSSGSCTSLDLLIRGESEVSIGAPLTVPKNVTFRPLVELDNYLVVRHDHPLADQTKVGPRDLARYPMIAPVEEGSLWQRLHHSLSKHELDCKIVMRLDSSEARLRYAELGLGSTIAVAWERPPDATSKLRWIPLTGILGPTTYGLMTMKNVYLSSAASKLVDFIVASAPKFQVAVSLRLTHER